VSIFLLNTKDPFSFPDVDHALPDPNGLLAIGGDLTATRLIAAYRRGIFPWFNDGDPILWWSPDPRAVLFPERVSISRSLRKTLRRQPFQITFDHQFEQVMRACAQPRRDGTGTWISAEMIHSYSQLFRLGYAHSVEAWQNGRLVGGLYGVHIDRVFCGESMFSFAANASKVCLVYLCALLRRLEVRLIDCQVASPHLFSLGAQELPRSDFMKLIEQYGQNSTPAPSWKPVTGDDLELFPDHQPVAG